MTTQEMLSKAESTQCYNSARQFGSKFDEPYPITDTWAREMLKQDIEDGKYCVVGWNQFYDSILICRPSDKQQALAEVSKRYFTCCE